MVSDIIMEVDACCSLSTPKVFALLRQLESEGSIEHVVIDDTEYDSMK